MMVLSPLVVGRAVSKGIILREEACMKKDLVLVIAMDKGPFRALYIPCYTRIIRPRRGLITFV